MENDPKVATKSSVDELVLAALTPSQAALWKHYQQLEIQGLRKPALQTLTAFINALKADTDQRRVSFTEAFCLCAVGGNVTLRSHGGGREGNDQAVSGIYDKAVIFSLRRPLLAEIIAPCLTALYYQRDVRVPYWLAVLYFHLRSLPADLLPTDFPELSQNALLREAMKYEPSNTEARARLINSLSSQFNYALHELPSGVLFGWNGATVEECEIWMKDLEEFRKLVEEQGETEKYRTEIHEWGFHFRGYADYLTYREQYQNYADYISRHWQE